MDKVHCTFIYNPNVDSLENLHGHLWTLSYGWSTKCWILWDFHCCCFTVQDCHHQGWPVVLLFFNRQQLDMNMKEKRKHMLHKKVKVVSSTGSCYLYISSYTFQCVCSWTGYVYVQWLSFYRKVTYISTYGNSTQKFIFCKAAVFNAESKF